MKIIRNDFLPPGRRYGAINLMGVVFVRRDMVMTPPAVNHEAIHTAQMRELLFVPFYLIYVAEWLLRLMQHRGNTFRAYRAISFEREAYANAHNPAYLRHRRHFAQWRHHS